MMEENNISNLKELKFKYDELKSKYGLPEFSELNKSFDIEDIDAETEFLLRRIRRIVSDKVLSYLKFLEIILNPSNGPLFFFKLIKKLDSKDREDLGSLYEELGKVEVEIIGLDIEYSEKNEAEFIKRLYRTFNEDVKIKLIEVVKKLGNGSDDREKVNSGSYFG